MSDCFIGEIRLWPSSRLPKNWLFCNGESLNIRDYETLFSLIGTTYGGDGAVKFNIPDLTGRVPLGQGQGPARAPQTTALIDRVCGQKGGATEVPLTTAQMPSHTHAVLVNGSVGTSPVPTNNMLAGLTPDYSLYQSDTTTQTLVTLDTDTITSSGAGLTHANVMPTSPINYIICTQGLYPTQN